jgi:hypothetical protein
MIAFFIVILAVGMFGTIEQVLANAMREIAAIRLEMELARAKTENDEWGEKNVRSRQLLVAKLGRFSPYLGALSTLMVVAGTVGLLSCLAPKG